jgi:hypothetical protein
MGLYVYFSLNRLNKNSCNWYSALQTQSVELVFAMSLKCAPGNSLVPYQYREHANCTVQSSMPWRPNEKSQMFRPLDNAPFERFVSWVARSLGNPCFCRRVPWSMCPSFDASLWHCVPWRALTLDHSRYSTYRSPPNLTSTDLSTQFISVKSMPGYAFIQSYPTYPSVRSVCPKEWGHTV